MSRPPLPPCNEESAIQKVRETEDTWNTRDTVHAALAYTAGSRRCNRAELPRGREEIETLLSRKWTHELGYRLIGQFWTFAGNSIAVRFADEYHNDSGQWFRACSNENWQFDAGGLMELRFAGINGRPIAEAQR